MLRSLILLLMAVFGLFCSPALLAHSVSDQFAQRMPLESSHLPIIVLESIDTITIDDKVMGRMQVYWSEEGDSNFVTDIPHYDGWIGIEFRGSSSALFPKPQFNIETRMPDGSNLNFPLLGLPDENDWILHGPFSDKSLLRNVLAYNLYAAMGHYSARTRFCEVVLDGAYQGFYIFTEKIKVDEGRLDLAELEPSDIDGDQVTGGYVFKLDKRSGSQQVGWYSQYPGLNGSGNIPWYQFHHPKPSNLNEPQRNYLIGYMNSVERKLLQYPALGTQELRRTIDFDSFIDHLLLYELSRNVDGYRLSTFMYKDKDSKDERLFLGPVWDFNIAFGNADYYLGAEPEGWQIDFATATDTYQLPLWWRTLLDNGSFRAQLSARWDALRTGAFHQDSLEAQIDQWVVEIGGAQQRNFSQWEILDLYVWPNAFVGNTYEAEIQYLKDWLSARLEFIDGAIETIGRDENSIATLTWLSNNPASNFTYLTVGVPDLMPVAIQLFSLNGQLVKTYAEGEEIAYGYHTFKLEVSEFPAGVYLLRTVLGSEQFVSKLVIF